MVNKRQTLMDTLIKNWILQHYLIPSFLRHNVLLLRTAKNPHGEEGDLESERLRHENGGVGVAGVEGS